MLNKEKIMYKYKVQVKKVSGRLNESVLPSKNLVIKSKTKKNKSELLSETSKFFKNKYGLKVESIGIQSDRSKYVAVFGWGETREHTYDDGYGGSANWDELPVKEIYFSTKEELLQQIEDNFYAPSGAAKKMYFVDDYADDEDGYYYVSWCTTDADGMNLMTRGRKHFFEQMLAFNIYDNTPRKQVRI